MKNALIIGLSGFNLGDEAIAVASYIELRKKFETVTITTVRPGTLEKYGIPEVVLSRRSLKSWISICKNIKAADTVYIGGGSLIQDKLGVGLVTGVLSFFLQMVLLTKLLAKNVKTLPIGADKLDSRLGRFYAHNATTLLKNINLRDNQSEINIKNLTNKAKTQVYADPAYLLKAPQSPKKNRILISLVHENIDFSRLQLIHKALIESLDEQTHEIFYIAMEKRESDEISLYRELGISNDKVIIPSDIHQVIKEIRESKLLIAMRLHALILGHGHIPLLGISRTTKTTAFCQEGCVPYFDLDNIPHNLTAVVRKMASLSMDNFDAQQKSASAKIELAKLFFNDN